MVTTLNSGNNTVVRYYRNFYSRAKKFDFAYVDSTKQFDWILVDFFYLDKILDVNGVIVFDDVTWPGIRKVLRLVSQFPSYKVYGQHPENYLMNFLRKYIAIYKRLKNSVIANERRVKQPRKTQRSSSLSGLPARLLMFTPSGLASLRIVASCLAMTVSYH